MTQPIPPPEKSYLQRHKKLILLAIAVIIILLVVVAVLMLESWNNSVRVGEFITISGTMSGLTKSDLGADTVWTISDSRGLFLIEDYDVDTGQWYLVEIIKN
jgi:hypothetical protein